MNTRKYSKNQESRVSKKIKGTRQPNSGATPFRKGDVLTDHFCIECKTMVSEKASISIKSEWIQKLQEEAFAMGKSHWALAFNFGGLDNKENFYIISESLFNELKRSIEDES